MWFFWLLGGFFFLIWVLYMVDRYGPEIMVFAVLLFLLTIAGELLGFFSGTRDVKDWMQIASVILFVVGLIGWANESEERKYERKLSKMSPKERYIEQEKRDRERNEEEYKQREKEKAKKAEEERIKERWDIEADYEIRNGKKPTEDMIDQIVAKRRIYLEEKRRDWIEECRENEDRNTPRPY